MFLTHVNLHSCTSGGKGLGKSVPVLKDPKKISKMLKKLQKVLPCSVKALSRSPLCFIIILFGGLLSYVLCFFRRRGQNANKRRLDLILKPCCAYRRRWLKLLLLVFYLIFLFQIDRFSAMESVSEKDTKRLRNAGVGKK